MVKTRRAFVVLILLSCAHRSPVPTAATLLEKIPPKSVLEWPRGTLSIRGRLLHGQNPASSIEVLAMPLLGERFLELPRPLACGAPMFGAALIRAAMKHEAEPPVVAKAQSQTDGSFILEGLAPGRYALWASGGDKNEVAVAVGVEAGAEAGDVPLQSPQWIEGVVTEPRGPPVAKARVFAVHSKTGRLIETAADAEGKYRIGPVPQGSYTVLAAHPDYVAACSFQIKATTPSRPLELQPLPRLSGRVTWQGKPVAGAEVWLETAHITRRAQSSSTGEFSFPYVPGEGLTVWAKSGSRIAAQVWDAMEDPPNVKTANLGLEESGKIDITVNEATGSPAAKVAVEGISSSGGATTPAITTALGRATLDAAPGTYAVHLDSVSHEAVQPRRINVAAGQRTRVEFQLDAPAEVPVVLKSDNGAPVSGAVMTARNLETPLPEYKAFSDADGRVVLRGLREGAYAVEVDHPLYPRLRAKLTVPANAVQWVMPRGFAVSGRVLNNNRQPVPFATVFLDSPISPQPGRMFPSASPLRRYTRANAKGEFTFRGLASGQFALLATENMPGPEVVTRWTRPVSLSVQRHVNGVQLIFEKPIQVRGQVVDENGKSIPNARVVLEPRDSGLEQAVDAIEMQELGGTVLSAEDGTFVLSGLSPAHFSIVAQAPGYAPGTSEISNAKVDKGPVVLKMMAKPIIRGRVVNARGEPVRQFFVNNKPTQSSDGTFETESYPGRPEHRLHIQAKGMAAWVKSVKLTGAVTHLGDVRVTPPRDVRVHVTDAETGAPLAEANIPEPIRLMNESVPPGKTDGEGILWLRGLLRDEVEVYVWRKDKVSRKFVIPANVSEASVALQSGETITGRIIRRDKQLPVQNIPISLVEEGVGILSGMGSTDAQGQWQLKGLKPGKYEVNVPSHAGMFFVAEHVEVQEGKPVQVVLKEVTNGVTVRVTAVNAAKKSVPVETFLIRGEVETPRYFGELNRPHVHRSIPPGEPFVNVPPGRYTAVAVGMGLQRGIVVSQQITLTSRPQQTFQLRFAEPPVRFP